MSKQFVVYSITNRINGKVYIGISSNFKKRKDKHLILLKSGLHYNSHLQRSFAKHGVENFKFEILEVLPSYEDLLECERYFIKLSNSFDRKCGFNLTYGGEGGRMTGELKLEVSNRMKNIERRKTWCQNISKALKGRNLGGKLSEHHRKAISYALTLQVQSEETKKKRALSQTGPKNHQYGKIANNAREVEVYLRDGTYLKTYRSCKLASLDLGIDSRRITSVARGETSYADKYVFKYTNKEIKNV